MLGVTFEMQNTKYLMSTEFIILLLLWHKFKKLRFYTEILKPQQMCINPFGNLIPLRAHNSEIDPLKIVSQQFFYCRWMIESGDEQLKMLED